MCNSRCYSGSILFLESQSVQKHLRAKLGQIIKGDGRPVPPATWQGVLKVIADRDRKASEAIARLQKLIDAPSDPPKANSALVVVQERDGPGLALRVFGMD